MLGSKVNKPFFVRIRHATFHRLLSFFESSFGIGYPLCPLFNAFSWNCEQTSDNRLKLFQFWFLGVGAPILHNGTLICCIFHNIDKNGQQLRFGFGDKAIAALFEAISQVLGINAWIPWWHRVWLLHCSHLWGYGRWRRWKHWPLICIWAEILFLFVDICLDGFGILVGVFLDDQSDQSILIHCYLNYNYYQMCMPNLSTLNTAIDCSNL